MVEGARLELAWADLSPRGFDPHPLRPGFPGSCHEQPFQRQRRRSRRAAPHTRRHVRRRVPRPVRRRGLAEDLDHRTCRPCLRVGGADATLESAQHDRTGAHRAGSRVTSSVVPGSRQPPSVAAACRISQQFGVGRSGRGRLRNDCPRRRSLRRRARSPLRSARHPPRPPSGPTPGARSIRETIHRFRVPNSGSAGFAVVHEQTGPSKPVPTSSHPLEQSLRRDAGAHRARSFRLSAVGAAVAAEPDRPIVPARPTYRRGAGPVQDGRPQPISVPEHRCRSSRDTLDDRPAIASATPNFVARVSGSATRRPGPQPAKTGPTGESASARQSNLLPCLHPLLPGHLHR